MQACHHNPAISSAAAAASATGLNLTVLPDLVSQLPRITTFTCSNCNRNSGTAVAAAVAGVPQLQLPDRLAELAPASLTMLSLGSSGIKGTLPESWSK
jgi:hypothetical protein